ncbi:MAG: cation:proton antiporter [Acidobacteriota bacterium]
MTNKLIVLVLVILSMGIVFFLADSGVINNKMSPTLIIGFMILSSYNIGFIGEKFGLPRITGYIFSGLLFGPYLITIYKIDTVESLSFLNSLALAFIAFNAGAELRIKDLAKEIKTIVSLTVGVTIFVFSGVTLTVFLLADLIPFMKGSNIAVRLGVSSIFGVISVARSPSSAIAIINETRSKGNYTNTILSVAVIMDVLIIILFAVIISVCEVLIKGKGALDINFILFLIFEIFMAFVLGYFLGRFISFLLTKLKVEFSVIIIALGFFVIKFSHFTGDHFNEIFESSINIEPLLICMAAGFTVQNFSGHGEIFLKRMDKISIPVYITFFTITGASINIDMLKAGWFFGIVIFISRIAMIYTGSYFSGKIAGSDKKILNNSWLGFITQAGVSLGLLTEVLRRFPEMGIYIQTILIASITLNQIIGPVGFKYGLTAVRETLEMRKNKLD